MVYWWETKDGKARLAVENKALQKTYPKIRPTPKFVTLNGKKYFGFEGVLETTLDLPGKTISKYLKIYLRYPPGYPHSVNKVENSIQVFPLAIVDKNGNPTDEQLNQGEPWHRWPDGRMCLFRVDNESTYHKNRTAKAIIAWAAIWWWGTCYKMRHGDWPTKELRTGWRRN